jgi:hypothetical protein
MLEFVLHQLRKSAVEDAELFSRIGTRFFPQPVDLESEENIYPLLTYSVSGGFRDFDGYPASEAFFEVFAISENTVDEAIEIYEKFINLIHQKRFTDPESSFHVMVVEDSKPIDASGIFGESKVLYIITGTLTAKTIG